MKWKEVISRIKICWLSTYKKALQQSAITLSIAGIYQRKYIDGDIKIVERIIIRQISVIAELYKIVKITRKFNSDNVKEVDKQKSDRWIATYDYSKRQLHELEGDRRCSFLPENLLLLIKDSKYKKVKSF